jgi:prophage regulatory protein
MVKRFIRLPDVVNAIGMSQRNVYYYMAAGKFPKPVKIGSMSMWVENEIEDWQNSQIAMRTGQTAPHP